MATLKAKTAYKRKIPKVYLDLGLRIRAERGDLTLAQLKEKIEDLKTKNTKTRKQITFSESYINQVEKGRTKASDNLIGVLERVFGLKPNTLFLIINKPRMDFIKALASEVNDPDKFLTSATEEQKAELIKYLRFLRLQEQLQKISP